MSRRTPAALAALVAAAPAGAVTLEADDRVADALASHVAGAPALAETDAASASFATERMHGAERRVLQVPAESGLALPGAQGLTSAEAYTVAIVARLSATLDERSFVDPNNRSEAGDVSTRGGVPRVSGQGRDELDGDLEVGVGGSGDGDARRAFGGPGHDILDGEDDPTSSLSGNDGDDAMLGGNAALTVMAGGAGADRFQGSPARRIA